MMLHEPWTMVILCDCRRSMIAVTMMLLVGCGMGDVVSENPVEVSSEPASVRFTRIRVARNRWRISRITRRMSFR